MIAAEITDNGAEAFALLSTIGALTAAAEFLALVCLLGFLAVLPLAMIVAAVALPIRRARERRRIRAAEQRIEGELLDQVAQEIAYCYGHGPLAVMDPQHREEFRRDARAALKAIGGRE